MRILLALVLSLVIFACSDEPEPDKVTYQDECSSGDAVLCGAWVGCADGQRASKECLYDEYYEQWYWGDCVCPAPEA